MNYQDFLKYKSKIKLDIPQLLDLSNNNLYEYFESPKIPAEVGTGHINGKVYRCHMVEDYLTSFNLPQDWKARIGANLGVRQSLSVLFPKLPNWSIPRDVYPFYQEEIKKTHNQFNEYDTLHSEDIFKDVEDGTLLVTFPLKPKGDKYKDSDLARLRIFLSRNPSNLIVIDMVYWLNFEFPSELLSLYCSNQVVLLHSFSKMFLIPNCFGVSIFPDTQLGKDLRESYKTLAKDEEKLNKAFNALRIYRQVPKNTSAKILENIDKLMVKGLAFPVDSENPGYLYYSSKSPQEYLQEGVLVIPESVFGGTGQGSVISVLI